MKFLRFFTQSNEEGGTLTACAIQCADDRLDACLADARSIAYNGEVTVEDIPDPPAEPTQLDRVEAQTMYTAMMTDTLIEEDEADV